MYNIVILLKSQYEFLPTVYCHATFENIAVYWKTSFRQYEIKPSRDDYKYAQQNGRVRAKEFTFIFRVKSCSILNRFEICLTFHR